MLVQQKIWQFIVIVDNAVM